MVVVTIVVVVVTIMMVHGSNDNGDDDRNDTDCEIVQFKFSTICKTYSSNTQPPVPHSRIQMTQNHRPVFCNFYTETQHA